MPRKVLSGHRRDILSREKKERIQKVLDKTAPIDTFFAPSAPATTADQDAAGTSFASPSPESPQTPLDAASDDVSMQEAAGAPEDQLYPAQEAVIDPEVPNALSSDIGEWNVLTAAQRDYIVSQGMKTFQNRRRKYPETVTVVGAQKRRLIPAMFSKVLPCGDHCDRAWLAYSPRKASLFCIPCRVVHPNTTLFSGEGFTQWQIAHRMINKHELSQIHRKSVLTFFNLQTEAGRIDAALKKELDTATTYWRDVLKRCVAVTAYCCERGEPLRGKDEVLGSSSNGNFLGLLELVSQFDPLLDDHLKAYAGRGRGHTSYTTKTTCEEIVAILGNSVLQKIVSDVKTARYYSVSVDSTPDISHIDQLSICVRYVCPVDRVPVERFLTFLPIYSHTGQNLCDTLLDYLGTIGLEIANCRGQTYDNASNMSGQYSGMQRLLRNVNPLAEYSPCAAHSLNLVGLAAVGACLEATSFFGVINKLYTFFSSSTHRWEILSNHLAGKKVPKHPSDTRWSAKSDAVTAVKEGYNEMMNALDFLSSNASEKPDTRHEAASLFSAMEPLEFGILLELWNDILLRFNQSSKALQSEKIDFATSISLLQSLSDYTTSVRDLFHDYESRGIATTGTSTYKIEGRRRHKRKRFADDGSADDAAETLNPNDRFRVMTYNVIVDSLTTAIRHRLRAYEVLNNRFGFLLNFGSMEDEEIRDAATNLATVYDCDLSSNFCDEFYHFVMWFRRYRVCGIGESGSGTNLGAVDLCSMYKVVSEEALQGTFPETEIALRLFMCLMVTNCCGERSFSHLKRIKNEARSTMGQARLAHLSLLTIEREVLRQLDFSGIIDTFAKAKARKVSIDPVVNITVNE